MYVYARDRKDGTINVVTSEECETQPWRWEFVQVAPGQEDVEEVVIKPVEIEKVVDPEVVEVVVEHSVGKSVESKKKVSKK